MELKNYALFLSMAETGNLTRTAEYYGYTQSGVSHILKGMEEELGFALFTRSKRGVKLTANGELMLPYVRQLLKGSDSLEQMISLIRGVQRGHLTVGAFVSISMYWMPQIIARFRKDYPQVTIEIKEGNLEELEGWLEAGIVDLAFLSRSPARKGDWIPLQEDELLLVVPADFPVYGQASIRPEQLSEYPIIMTADSAENDIRQLVHRNGLMDNVRYTTTNAYTMIAMVEAHLGVTILPRLIADSIDCDYHLVRTLPLEPKVVRHLGIALPGLDQAAPAVKEFITYARAGLERSEQ